MNGESCILYNKEVIMIKELIRLSNHLDAKGLRKEADYLDAVIRKAANEPSMLTKENASSELASAAEGSRIFTKCRGRTSDAFSKEQGGWRSLFTVSLSTILRDYIKDEFDSEIESALRSLPYGETVNIPKEKMNPGTFGGEDTFDLAKAGDDSFVEAGLAGDEDLAAWVSGMIDYQCEVYLK
tara:strand:+ start:16092 stop:16640 length:549 start_codon:yes stop_codon:yes gene_type:complete